MPRKSTAPLSEKKDMTPGQTFLTELKSSSLHYLKDIASALYRTTKQRREAVLTHLRNGDLVASVHWPGPDDLVDLPPKLWYDVPNETFKVRSHNGKRWQHKDFSLPAALLIRHLGVHNLRAIIEESGTAAQKIEAALPADSERPGETSAKTISVSESRLYEAIRIVGGNRRKAEVFVTSANARLFADMYLGSLFREERRGRNRTSDVELLLVEMFRQLHLTPVNRLPPHKAFTDRMLRWWNDGDRQPRGVEWARKKVQLVYSALKATPKL